MINKSKHRGLLIPKFIQINKQQFNKIHFVRSLYTDVMGQHFLLSWNRKKYIFKEFSASQAFATTRKNTCVYQYDKKSCIVYIFPLLGEPLSNLLRQRAGEEIKRWICRCQLSNSNNGSYEEALLEVIRLALRNYEQFGIDDILIQCFRVHNGQLLYIYDSWMNNSMQIVSKNPLQIQSYYFGQGELKQLKLQQLQKQNQSNKRLTQKDDEGLSEKKSNKISNFLNKLSLLLLNLGLPEIKSRNYEFFQYEYNWKNIEEKLRYFKARYQKNRIITELVEKLINNRDTTMKDIWKVVQNYGTASLTLHEKSLNTSQTTCFNQHKAFTQGYGTVCHSKKRDSHPRATHFESRTTKVKQLNQITNLYLKPKVDKRRKSLSRCINESEDLFISKSTKMKFNHSICDENLNNSQSFAAEIEKPNVIYFQKEEGTFELRKLLLQSDQLRFNKKEQNSHFCIKIIDSLGLGQYVPKNLYEKSVLKALENFYIKQQWRLREYPNGSIYFGDLAQNLDPQLNTDFVRDGKGIYLFDSHDLYYGDWVNNNMQGIGTYVFKSGQMYAGELIKGLKHGFGKFTYSDGRVYQGYWDNNNKVGLGTVFFPNQVKFFGIFKQSGQKMTEGVFTRMKDDQLLKYYGCLENYNWQLNQFQSHNAYQSEQSLKKKLKLCKINNFNVCDDELGNKYYGECSDNMPEGFGIKQSENEIYEGNWLMGKQEGDGKLVVKDRFDINGKWRQGVLIQYYMR